LKTTNCNSNRRNSAHRHYSWIVQSYSWDGIHMYPHLLHGSLSTCKSALKTVS